jgi:hypothetical protein
MRFLIRVWVVTVLVLGALFLAKCDNDDDVDQTPNVSFEGDEEELQDLAAVLSLPDGIIIIPYDPDAPQAATAALNTTEDGVLPETGSLRATESFVPLGSGYFSMQEAFRFPCFKGEQITGGRVETAYLFDMVESKQELHKKMGVSTSASVGVGLFSLNASLSFLRNLDISTHTIAAVAKYDVLGTSLTFKYRPEPDFPKALAPENAYKLCGDYYVHSLRSGATLYAVITIETSSQTEKNKIQAELSASYGAFGSVKGSYNSEFSNTLNKYGAKINAASIGCKTIPPVTNWQEYLDVLKTFEADTRECLKDPTAAFVTATLERTDVFFEGEGIIPEPLDTQKDALKQLINFNIEYEQLLKDLEHFRIYIDTYDITSLYDSRDRALLQISATENKIEGIIQQIRSRIEDCQRNPYSCAFLSELALPVADHPDNLRDAVIPDISFLPESCDALLVNGDGFLDDGEYTLYFQGRENQPFQAHCENMDPSITDEPPKTYLALVDQDDNFSQFKHLWKWVKTDPRRAGPTKRNILWNDLKTSYNRIRVDVEQNAVYIDVLDNTFAENEREAIYGYPFHCKPGIPDFNYVPFGIGWRSNHGSGLPKSSPGDPVASIDLRGTKFRIANDERWAPIGYQVKSYSGATIRNNRQTVSLQVMGNVGAICPSNYPRIKLDYCSDC